MESPIVDEQGYFWWADADIPAGHFAPKEHVGGRLVIAADGTTRLELDGLLPSELHLFQRLFPRDETVRVPRAIRGLLKRSGDHVLLLDAVGNGGSFSTNRFSYERYLATICLVGRSPFSALKRELRFSLIEIDLEGFEQWLQLGNIKLENSRRSVTAKNANQKKSEFLTNIGKITLNYRTESTANDSMWTYEVKLKEIATLSFRPEKACNGEDMRNFFSSLQDLMIVLTDAEQALQWPDVRVSRTKKNYRMYFFRRATASKTKLSWHELPTNFPRIERRFGEIFEQWQNKREKFGAGIHSFSSTRRGFPMYIESKFLTLSTGLEALHRAKNDDSQQSPALQEKIKRIIEKIDRPKDRKWLESALRHKGEPSLEERLVSLFSDLPISLQGERVRDFSKKCAQLRNDLAHFAGNRGRKDNANFLVEVNALNFTLSTLYHLVILREIGIDDAMLRYWMTEQPGASKRRGGLADVALIAKEDVRPRGATSDAQEIAAKRDEL